MILMFISIGMIALTGVIFLIWGHIKYAYNLDDKPKVSKSEVTEIPTKTDIPTKADVERYNNQIRQQKIINDQNAKQHIIAILDVAYKNYINKQIENNKYIDCRFILGIGDYGLTFDEIYAIRDNTLSHGIYKVEYQCRSSIFAQPYLIVTVNN